MIDRHDLACRDGKTMNGFFIGGGSCAVHSHHSVCAVQAGEGADGEGITPHVNSSTGISKVKCHKEGGLSQGKPGLL